ncbi:peptidoglycan editing factor PgeF [Thermoactinospora rubra]|uniref:peptidoglycan editing factor PgeF n=1 Tax=Thermoactinospora rubra TaxID=1088767 RepID=UPI000A113ECD|nr:peptidoglycan editing factor PgeF [Thermoactinospora rubra]
MQLAPGVHVTVTDRHGGVSAPPYGSRNLGGMVGDAPEAVRANRRALAAELGVDGIVFMRQVHGAGVAFVTEPFGPDAPEVDAVFTTTPRLALASLGADCPAVLVADPRARMVGAAHSGRPGTEAGVAAALVEAMAGKGASPAAMVALVGPGACGRCYEVPAELRDRVAAKVPQTRSVTSWGTPALDLRAGIEAQLRAAGVRDVRHDARCTIESPELYSHRREGVCGRFAGLIWLEEPVTAG